MRNYKEENGGGLILYSLDSLIYLTAEENYENLSEDNKNFKSGRREFEVSWEG
jgi:hypothetical protein